MRVDPVGSEQAAVQGREMAANLAAQYPQSLPYTRRPLLGDVLQVDGGVAKVVGVQRNGVTIEVEDTTGRRRVLSREPTGWWTRA